MPQGTIKDFDPTTRDGSLMLEDNTEVRIDATSIEGGGILYLRIGQRVRFDIVEEAGHKFARTLRLVTF